MSEDRIVLSLTADDLEEKVFSAAEPGWYKVEIAEVEKKASKSEKNPGKPFYQITYNSLDKDAYSGKFFNDNVMLWHGAHFSLVGILKALGLAKEGELIVPTEDELIGQELEVYVNKVKYTRNDGTEGERNEVKRYRSLDAGAKGGATSKAKAKAGKFTL